MRLFIMEAGWGIWPVLAFGLITLVLAIRHIQRPDASRLPLIIGFGLTTLLFGALGTIIGVQTSARYIAEVTDAERWIFVLGLRESLNNMVAALFLVVVSTLATTFGTHRQNRDPAKKGYFAQA